MSRVVDMAVLLRPLHWVKNLVVFGPLLFAGLLIDPPSFWLCLETFAVFCLAASGVYAFNDINDRRSDAAHPVKSRRPVASGALPVWLAAGLGLACVSGALVWSWSLEQRTPPLFTAGLGTVGVAGWISAYLVLNAFYTLALKRLAFADVSALASGFALRAFAGASALQLQPSRWLVICVFGLALFLALGKRHLELYRLGTDADLSRPMWLPYPPGWLSRLLTLVAYANVAAYAWYTLSPETVAKVGSRGLLFSLPMVVFCIGRLRGMLLFPQPLPSTRGLSHIGGDPVELVLHDRPCLAAMALWLATSLAVVYRPW